jgi:hypothetical protein
MAGNGPAQATSPLVEQFRAVVAGAHSDDEREVAVRRLVDSLDERDQLALARALVKTGKPDEEAIGASMLVERRLEKEAAPAFARFVAGGGDLTAYAWAWLHSGDDKRMLRVYVAISRALLATIDTLTGEPRRRAEGFLLDGYGPHLDTFSRTAVEAKLAALERDIR